MLKSLKLYAVKRLELLIVTALIIISVIVEMLIVVFHHDKYIDMVLGYATGVIVVSLVKLPPAIVTAFQKRRKKGNFQRFFGDAAVQGNVTLLFAHRTMKSTDALKFFDTFYDPVKDGKISGATPVPEGIDIWLPLQDFRGANHVASEIAQMTNNTPQYRTDRSISDLGFDELMNTIVSFGLGFNGFTHTLCELTDRKLFDVTWGPTQRSETTEGENILETDNFLIDAKGFPDKSIKGPFDYAFVARICASQPIGRPSRYFFICAGRTASGTAAAGYYLANHWEDLYDMYKEKDLMSDCLVVLIKHWYGHSGTTKNAARDADSTAIAHIAVDKPVVQWFNIKTRIAS